MQNLCSVVTNLKLCGPGFLEDLIDTRYNVIHERNEKYSFAQSSLVEDITTFNVIFRVSHCT